MTLPVLEEASSYTHAGSYFSKIWLLKNTLTHYKKDILLISRDEKDIKKYLSLTESLHIPGKKLGDIQSVNDIGKDNDSGQIYFLCVNDLGKHIPKIHYKERLIIKKNEITTMEQCFIVLQNLGYEYSEYGKDGSYFSRGDQLFIQKNAQLSYTLTYWGDEVESIKENGVEKDSLELSSLTSLDDMDSATIHTIPLVDILQEKKELFIVSDEGEFFETKYHIKELFPKSASFDIVGSYNSDIKKYRIPLEILNVNNVEELKKLLLWTDGHTTIYTKYRAMMEEFLEFNKLSHITLKAFENTLAQSFRCFDTQYICDDILSHIFIRKRSKKALSSDIDLLLKISPGDYVVHIDHGIGIYQGIITKELPQADRTFMKKEYLEIHYKDKDKLFIPMQELARISKYVGVDHPQVHSLSGKAWEKKMKKITEDIQETAEELLANFAARKLRNGKACKSKHAELEHFVSLFPFVYTEDQAQAIEEVRKDMQSEKNMDRLIVGDVGFGKTEIAFYASYLAILNGRQAVLIAPLVVLAHEHYHKAIERFAGLGVRIAILTRLQSNKEASRVLRALKSGEIDLVIGTHRLLSEDIEYKNLGLLIVDEEHKFGVNDKERIKMIKQDIDILSLSATPIPRSLNLALSGVRDISLLKTPPKGRKSIETVISRYNETMIKEAGKREFARGGQIFFIHNRVQSIEIYKKQLESFFPQKKIIVTHGQLPGEELENRIIDFKERRYDILLSTTVIENGIDFPNVNTIFINECQQYGISQIHQLRGRVGRSNTQGYCYLLYRKEKLDREAAKRIQTMVDYSYLGAGFELAMKDLEIRGGGDILGVKQSGHSKEIGVSLFLKMLEQKIAELKQGKSTMQKKHTPTQIDIPLETALSESYFLTESDKLQFYRELEYAETLEDIDILEQSMFSDSQESKDTALENIFLLARVKIYGKDHHIKSIKKIGMNYHIEFFEGNTLDRVKKLLSQDTALHLQVIDIQKLKCPIKVFTDDKKFLQYMLSLFSETSQFSHKKVLRKK